MDMTPESKYISASDLGGRERTLIMKEVQFEEVGQMQDRKPVLYFNGAKKGLILNKTNRLAIIAEYGKYSENWMGQPLILFPTKVPFQGQIKDAVRVRKPLQTNPNVTTGPQPAPQVARPSSSEIDPPADPNAGAYDDAIPF